MPRAATSLSSKFSGHVRYLDMTRNKMERLLSTNDIVIRDIDQVYAGLYLDAVASFERLIEDLFIGLASGRLTVSSVQAVPLVSFTNKRAMYEIISGGRRYVDWLPYNRTEDLANRFFQQGLPFTTLSNSEKRQIEMLGFVRNAIAHRSDHSKRVFQNNVIGNQSLMNREKTPAGYLRSVFRVSPLQRRYDDFVNSMAAIAIKLCS